MHSRTVFNQQRPHLPSRNRQVRRPSPRPRAKTARRQNQPARSQTSALAVERKSMLHRW
jgi:hypothetical protein